MFKKLGLVACVLVSCLWSITASAGVIVDVVNQNAYVPWWGSYSYTHDITDDGFSFGTAESATLEIKLSDDGGPFDLWENILVQVENFDFDTGGILFSVTDFYNDVEITALGALNLDGMLDVTVYSTLLGGDFFVGNSTLTVTTVPAPSVLILLVLGIAGLMSARRSA